MRIRFDQGPKGAGTCFASPQRVIRADQPHQVPAALADLDAMRAAGKWLAGYASYELGYALEPKLAELMPADRRLPLICFGVYDAPVGRVRRCLAVPGEVGLQRLTPRWDFDRYATAFAQVKQAIGAGDIYQANLTFPLDAVVLGDSDALYAALMDVQPVGHGVLVEQDDLPDLLSRSPELFFRTDADGMIETRPMKGTQPRSADPVEDAARRDFLQRDEKNRAENLMIVDLLRNDISRVAQTGSVSVPELFAVETYATVHQMVSTVRAQLRPGVGLGDILTALFPCGSITGAPKISAMQILADLEPDPREIYCGTIGWAAPDGRSCFNVAIRTLMVESGKATLNVGGGVVWDSTAESEYEEALWKTRFARQMTPTFA
ncbi:aminodeoxychorismate synthase component I [Parasedimentitalea psychrophila]|uniref:Aminodeoxychorismate synthase component I n=1 Tax=Parasedimentitalea psychrophila TaxID=2997337 RepID=A0A9Y2KWA5_9RHOB|nr:aminodeoxychorismate synthase component I [Parasedimentitalea psychrophila]WIY23485.1 aminodeoxychorismate synthase component I [Parasedimentitalea psychrophila]